MYIFFRVFPIPYDAKESQFYCMNTIIGEQSVFGEGRGGQSDNNHNVVPEWNYIRFNTNIFRV